MTNVDNPRTFPRRRYWLAPTILVAGVLGSLVATPKGMSAAQEPVDLGRAANTAVLAGTAVTATKLVTVSGNLDLSPGTALTGFPPGEVREGSAHLDDAHAKAVAAAAAAAYQNVAARTPTATVAAELGGTTRTPGVYKAAEGVFTLDGTLTLDAEGDPGAVFVFQADSALNTARVSNIALANGAKVDNIFWQVGDSATIGTLSTFQGNVLALNSITVAETAVVYGRTLALNGTVELRGSAILPATRVSLPGVTRPRTTTTLTSSPNPSTAGQAVTFTATVSAVTGSLTPTGRVLFRDGSTRLGIVLTDATGVARFTTSSLSAGTHQITAVYVSRGTAMHEAWVLFMPSRSNVLSQEVLAAR
ncbi:ice-binding family protein [Streptosporangium carneum]|uniref:Bacterial Ig-like domain-containing protein n=1 Tax=Streptosporangium carneum TaxID=47481 RepID=A0A9W6IB91_9ACTN|nr:ice-binding family protein [Streptosporangium carneum]GLK14300.1 hypothetical protein GCM10017600_77120 [Streptosporangium carneum]